MPVNQMLIRLGDLVSQIDSTKTLLERHWKTPLDGRDKAHLEEMLHRLQTQKTELELELKAILESRSDGVSGS